jgi:hypothetical protein
MTTRSCRHGSPAFLSGDERRMVRLTIRFPKRLTLACKMKRKDWTDTNSSDAMGGWRRPLEP